MSNRLICRVSDCGAQTNAYLCKACAHELELALTDLPALMHEVSLLATKQARVYRTSGVDDEALDELAEMDEEYGWRRMRIPAHLRTRDDRVTLPETLNMVNPYARALLAETSNTIVTWARHWNESRGIGWVRHVEGRGFVVTLRGEMPESVQAVNTWLVDNAEAARFDEAGAVMHHEIIDLQRRLRRAVDRSPSRVYAGPCNNDLDNGGVCKRPLYAWPVRRHDDDEPNDDEDSRIVCDGYRPPHDRSDGYDPKDRGCGKKHYRTDRRDWLIADLEDRLLPLSLWEDTLPGLLVGLDWPRNRSTWWRWAKRLEVKTVIDGVEFFRGGDVIALCLREQQRIRANGAKSGRLSA